MTMQTYQCWCPVDNRLPNEFIEAETSFEARKVYARKHNKQASECVGRRQLTAAERSAH